MPVYVRFNKALFGIYGPAGSRDLRFAFHSVPLVHTGFCHIPYRLDSTGNPSVFVKERACFSPEENLPAV